MYTIINDKKYNIIPMSSFFNKTIGLMFRKDIISDIYLFSRCSCIHTFFMKQNIDVCILDKDFKILYLVSNLKKNKILIKKGYYTLEMPLGTACFLKIGSYLKIK